MFRCRQSVFESSQKLRKKPFVIFLSARGFPRLYQKVSLIEIGFRSTQHILV